MWCKEIVVLIVRQYSGSIFQRQYSGVPLGSDSDPHISFSTDTTADTFHRLLWLHFAPCMELHLSTTSVKFCTFVCFIVGQHFFLTAKLT